MLVDSQMRSNKLCCQAYDRRVGGYCFLCFSKIVIQKHDNLHRNEKWIHLIARVSSFPEHSHRRMNTKSVLKTLAKIDCKDYLLRVNSLTWFFHQRSTRCQELSSNEDEVFKLEKTVSSFVCELLRMSWRFLLCNWKARNRSFVPE